MPIPSGPIPPNRHWRKIIWNSDHGALFIEWPEKVSKADFPEFERVIELALQQMKRQSDRGPEFPDPYVADATENV